MEQLNSAELAHNIAGAGLAGENWRPVPTYEGLYEASDQGRIRSVPRRTHDGRLVGGRILKAAVNPQGYLRIGLKRPDENGPRSHFVHRLVLWAFTGENPPELDTRHMDGDPGNNRLANLRFGTVSENVLDCVRHGTWVNNNKFTDATHCIHGHPFDAVNTYWRPAGGRACRTCRAEACARSRAARAQRSPQ